MADPFRFFRALLPRSEGFIDQLSAHARHVVSGAETFAALLSGQDMDETLAALFRHEEAADAVTKEIVLRIRRAFITPFDRSQILDLVTALDDTIDLMKAAGRRIRLYGIMFTPEMRGMAACALRATTHIRDAMPMLGDIAHSVDGLARMQDDVRAAESEADDLLEQGLRAVFASDFSPGQKLTLEKVYDLIESIVDRCEDVADVIEGIVVEQV